MLRDPVLESIKPISRTRRSTVACERWDALLISCMDTLKRAFGTYIKATSALWKDPYQLHEHWMFVQRKDLPTRLQTTIARVPSLLHVSFEARVEIGSKKVTARCLSCDEITIKFEACKSAMFGASCLASLTWRLCKQHFSLEDKLHSLLKVPSSLAESKVMMHLHLWLSLKSVKFLYVTLRSAGVRVGPRFAEVRVHWL